MTALLPAAAAVLWLAALAGSAWGTWHLARAQPPLAAYAPPEAVSGGGPAAAAARLTIVVVQGLTWADLAQLPARDGTTAAALLTPPPAGGRVDAAYLTVGAGAPAVVPELPVPPLDRGARWWDAAAGDLHRRLAGADPGQAAVVVPALARLASANRDRSPAVTPGWLGEALARSGLRAAVLGEADFAGRYDGRGAALLAMDSAGTVAYGRLEGMTRPDDAFPAGVGQDWDALLLAWETLPGDAALVVIESGDLRRLEAAAPLLDHGRWLQAREQALQRLRRGLEQLLAAAARRPGRNPVWVLAAAPAQAPAAAAFGVLWTWSGEAAGEVEKDPDGGGSAGPGGAALLGSPSARRWGVVPLTDVTAAVLAELGAGTAAPLGRGMAAGTDRYPWDLLAPAGTALEAALAANHAGRVPLIQGYVVALIVTAAAALAAVRWRGLGRVVAWAAPGMAAVPLAFLLLPGLGIQEAALRALVTGVLAAAASVWASRLGTACAFAVLAGLTVAAVAADVLLGGTAAVRSPLGHSLLVGARYYGIGNEYGGVLVGSAALAGGLAAGAARGAGPRPGAVRAGRTGPAAALACLVPAAAAALLLHPGLGANFGCGLAALASAGVLALKVPAAAPRSRRAAVLAAAGAAAAAAVLILLDMAGGAQASHIGRAAQQAAAADWQSLREVALRKVRLNWRLIQYAIWSRMFVVSLAAVSVLVLRPAAGLRRLSQRDPGLFAGIVAAVMGAGAALLLNDSGVVAAATAMIFPTAAAAHALLASGRPPGPESVDTQVSQI
nr:hypothetical protein [Bacillota bacterium]